MSVSRPLAVLVAVMAVLATLAAASQPAGLSTQDAPPDEGILAAADPAAGRYLVGAATRDITPEGEVNKGGFGLGDGSTIPEEIIGPGRRGAAETEQIRARAIVIDDGTTPVAVAVVESIGMFVAYDTGAYGLVDAARAIEDARPRLATERIVLTANHSHGGPDTLGPWGFVDDAYMQHIHDQTVAAVVAAYDARRPARLRAGTSQARDLVYNQVCTEALNQDPEPNYPGPRGCLDPVTQDVVDAGLDVVQAVDGDGQVVATLLSYAAHATLGGAPGVHGDWPQFLSDALADTYGGVGIAVQGANGRVQPCRSRCAHTDPDQPGYDLDDRRAYWTTALLAHVEAALDAATGLTGAVDGAQRTVTEPVTGPAVAGLFTAGDELGAGIRRSREAPWTRPGDAPAGAAITTLASALRVGDLLLAGYPGEAYPNIAVGIADAVDGELDVVSLGLANDMLGYLIAPAEAYPFIAAQAPVNDNSIFNVSPTIGDHVMCADIALAEELGFTTAAPPRCAAYGAVDTVP